MNTVNFTYLVTRIHTKMTFFTVVSCTNRQQLVNISISISKKENITLIKRIDVHTDQYPTEINALQTGGKYTPNNL